MFSLKSILLIAACIILTTSASPIEYESYYEPELTVTEEYEFQPDIVRHVRSPQGGSFGGSFGDGPFGREGSINYNHNLYTSSDGRGRIDAYAQGVQNFDTDRKSFNGGITGSWSF